MPVPLLLAIPVTAGIAVAGAEAMCDGYNSMTDAGLPGSAGLDSMCSVFEPDTPDTPGM